MATADPDDDVGVDPEDSDDELPVDDVLPLDDELLLDDVLPLDDVLLLVVVWCAEAGRATAIPATPSTPARPTPAVAAATFLFPRCLAA